MKSLISKYLPAVVAAAAVVWAVPGYASTSGLNSGSIENIFVSSTTKFPQNPVGDFLITIAGLDTLCPGHGFAYLLVTDGPYYDYAALINESRFNAFHGTSPNQVYVYWTTDANGYCHITKITLVT